MLFFVWQTNMRKEMECKRVLQKLGICSKKVCTTEVMLRDIGSNFLDFKIVR